jgi:aspartate 1-decarboxylase
MMNIRLLKGKLHQACVTHSELDYDGSCAIDADLLEASGIIPFEQIHIYNITNGERFVTYAIKAEHGSGIISVNGAAAHKANPGDRVIICAYADFSASHAESFEPRLVYLDKTNKITRMSHEIAMQMT